MSRGSDGLDLVRLAELLSPAPERSPDSPRKRLAEIWRDALGAEVAANTQPRFLKGGRLTVATSSAVWAQTLQLMEFELVARLNAALGEETVERAVFRPAGWDPGGGAGSPRQLGETWPPQGGRPEPATADLLEPAPDAGGLSEPGRRRRLTREEEQAVREVGALACSEELGRRIAGAMRASLRRVPGR